MRAMKPVKSVRQLQGMADRSLSQSSIPLPLEGAAHMTHGRPTQRCTTYLLSIQGHPRNLHTGIKTLADGQTTGHT